MMVSFDFLSKPITLSAEEVNVVCIENHKLFREIIEDFYNGCDDESAIVFSENFSPVKFKNRVCFISDFFNLNFSAQLLKKLYEELSNYANNYLQDETAAVQADILNLLEKLSQNYDFDFTFKEDTDIVDLLKIHDFKPYLSNGNLVEKLLDFTVLMKKYFSINCFVLLNLHSFFSCDEIALLYKELKYQKIEIIVLENQSNFKAFSDESVYIVDEDLCEIVANN